MRNKNKFLQLSFGNKKINKRIVSIDTEWAKNWRAKEKFVPFCTSIHSIYLDNISGKFLDIGKLYMKAELYFRSDSDTTQDYIEKVENMLAKYIDENTTIIGHQLSSDLHTFVHCSTKNLEVIDYLINKLKTRKKNKKVDMYNGFAVADTRYDIKKRIQGEEKLRCVSLRLNVFAIQNELNEMSLTKMYNQYLFDNDLNKREKLLVMNWRHAFQTALVWLVDSIYPDKIPYDPRFKNNFLTTNDIIFKMGKDHISYLNSNEFKQSTSLEGILEYLKKYRPQKIQEIRVRDRL